MGWWLFLEVFSPELIYIKGSKSVIADALSRLDKIDYLNNTYSNNNKVETTLESLSENFALNEEDVFHRTSVKTIMRFQQKDKSLIELPRKSRKTIPLNNLMGWFRCFLGFFVFFCFCLFLFFFNFLCFFNFLIFFNFWISFHLSLLKFRISFLLLLWEQIGTY